MRHLRISVSLLLLVLVAFTASAFDLRTASLSLDAKYRMLAPLSAQFDAARVAAYLDDPAWKSWNAAHGGNWTAQFDTLSGRPRRVYGGAIPWIAPNATDAQLETKAREFIAANQTLMAATNDRLRFVPEIASPTTDGRIRYAAFDYVIDGVPVESARLVFAVNNGNLIYWSSTNIAAVPVVTTPAISSAAATSALLAYTGVNLSDVNVRQSPQLVLLPRNGAAGGLLAYQLTYEMIFETSDHGTWAGYVDANSGQVVAFGNSNRYLCPQQPVGKVKGGVRPAQATDAEVVRSFPLVRTTTNGGPADTSINGVFTWGGGSVSTELAGTFFDVFCSDCVKSKTDPVEGWQPFTSAHTGLLNLGTGGGDEITATKTVSYGNGISTPADRTAFFHINIARLMAMKWLALDWLRNETVGTTVNINDVCNAFWNGTSTNFFKKGASGTLLCNNTGEIRDVMQHEWGHGLDDNDGVPVGLAAGFGDLATGEAVGDHVALFVDHDSCIGQSFATPRNTGPFVTNPDDPSVPVANCDGVRNTDELRATRGKLGTSNVTQKCANSTVNAVAGLAPYYVGPLLSEGHCEGEIWGQAAWHLQQNLLTGRAYGTATVGADKRALTYAGDALPAGADGSANPAIDRDRAWTLHERLFYASRPLVATYAPSHMQAIGTGAYDGYMVVDDEGDGLANGTPHAAYINDAFMDHGMEELGPPGIRPAVQDAANCAPLATPAVTTSQSLDNGTGLPAITISWSAVSGATSYAVMRTERRNDVFIPVAIVGAGTTSVTDAGVDNGVEYLYRVEARSNAGCYNGSSAGTASAKAMQPEVRFASVNIVDSPNGDGDGALDAGERASLFIVLENFGLASLTNAQVTLRSLTSGITVSQAGPRSYGSIAAGGLAGPDKLFRIDAAKNPALCGTVADFVLTITSAQGCMTAAFSIPIGNDGTSCTLFNGSNARANSIAVTNDKAGLCGDGDNYADAYETIEVTVVLENSGTKTANNVTVSLGVDKPYFTFAGPSSINVGSLEGAYAQTKMAVFKLAVGAAAPFGDVATFTATVGSNKLTQPVFVSRNKSLGTFNYGFELSAEGWTANGWARTLAPQTGNLTQVFYSDYIASTCPTLVSPVVEFSDSSVMSFDLAVVSENSDAAWDGSDIAVSVDGVHWIKLYPVEGYTELLAVNEASAGSNCIPKDEPLFSGVSPLMRRYNAPIPPDLAGKTGRVRFRFSADPLAEVPVLGGSWVDNVTLGNVVVATPDVTCP